MVGVLLKKAKANQSFIKEERDKLIAKKTRDEYVQEGIAQLNKNNVPIQSAKQVQQSIGKLNDDDVPLYIIKRILKHDFNMRFTRVKKVATTDNSERSLVLR